MEKPHLRANLPNRSQKSIERPNRLTVFNNERPGLSRTPILQCTPDTKTKDFIRNFEPKQSLYLPQLRNQNFAVEPKIKSQLKLIHENIRPSFSIYFQKFIEMPKITEGKKTLVLDLDETLIHSFAKLGAKSPVNAENFFFKVRPYVKELLEYASKRFELIVFTASNQDYADIILDKLDPAREMFKLRLYRPSCISTPIGLVKDLRILKNRSLENIILVDNNIISLAYQLDNGVPILSWYGDAVDTELLKLINYLKIIEKVPDVRKVLKTTFNLAHTVRILNPYQTSTLVNPYKNLLVRFETNHKIK